MGNIAYDFTGRTVIVTGAARGIGFEVASFFRKTNADVFLVDFDGPEVLEAAAMIGAIGLA